MIWWIVLAAVAALGAIPVGLYFAYDADGFRGRLILGPIRYTLFPQRKKEKKEETPESEQKPQKKAELQPTPEKAAPKPPQPPKPKPEEKTKRGGSYRDFLPLIRLGLDFLGDMRRKIRVKRLRLHLVLAGDDPCDLAVNYGRALAAVKGLTAQLERVFVIQSRNVNVECDFAADQTRITAEIDVRITLGRLLALTAVYGVRGLKEYWNLKKKRKGGAENESETSQHAGNNHSKNP